MTPEGMGGFALIVGPSGAGKDTLIALARAALAGDPRLVFPKRIVTRPSSAFEDHDTLDDAAFARAEAEGRFALSWRAHGLGYAVPGDVLGTIRPGRMAVCNVSRTVVEDARRTLPHVAVIEVTAPAELLARRLAARGRSQDGDLGARLARSEAIAIRADLTIVNDGSADEGAGKLVEFLRRHADALLSSTPNSSREGRESLLLWTAR